MESSTHFFAFALFFCVSRAAVLLRSTQIYTLNVQIDPSAVENIVTQQLNLIVSRGFLATGSPTFNTAWIVQEFSGMIAGSICYTWATQNRAMFVSEPESGIVAPGQKTTTSPTFSPGDSATFDGIEWSVRSKLSPPYIGLHYKVRTVALHPVLLAPFLSDDREVWSPYYYGGPEMANSVLEGQPTDVLALQMRVGVKQGSFIRSIAGDEVLVSYEGSASQTVCVLTPPCQENVVIKMGPCTL